VIIINPPATVILVNTLRAKLPVSIGRVEELRSIEDATARILEDAQREAELKPTIVVEDNDRIPAPGGERVIRVSARAPCEARKSVPPIATVVIIAARSLTPEIRGFLEAISETNTKRLLILGNDSEALHGLDAINNGIVDALLFINSANYSDRLVHTVRRLKRQNVARRQAVLSQLFANGPTAFLAYPDISKLIEKSYDANVDFESYLSLDPPGILIRNIQSPAEFHLICDEDYCRAMVEIRNAVKSERNVPSFTAGGFSEEGIPDAWNYLLSHAAAVGADKKWLHVRFVDAGEGQRMFNELMASSHRCSD